MMSLLILENVVDQSERDLIDALGRDKLEALQRRFRELAPEIAGRRPAWLLRFGQARPPTGRTGRLPVDGGHDRSGKLSPSNHGRPAPS